MWTNSADQKIPCFYRIWTFITTSTKTGCTHSWTVESSPYHICNLSRINFNNTCIHSSKPRFFKLSFPLVFFSQSLVCISHLFNCIICPFHLSNYFSSIRKEYKLWRSLSCSFTPISLNSSFLDHRSPQNFWNFNF